VKKDLKMEFFRYTFSFISFAIILLSFFRPKIGAVIYLIYSFLVPEILIGNIIIHTRAISFYFFFVCIVKYRNVLFDRKSMGIFFPFLFFYMTELLFVFVSDNVPYAFSSYLTSIASLFYSLFLACIIAHDRASIDSFSSALLFAFFLFTIYGLFLTLTPGLNPYLMFISPFFNLEFNEAYAAGNSGIGSNLNLADNRMWGRISSVFYDPQEYVCCLGFFLLFCVFYLRHWYAKALSFVLVMSAIYVSGVRTGFAAVAITFLFSIFYYRKIKFALLVGVVFYTIWLGLPLISDSFSEYIDSITNPNTTYTGSTLDMRLSQLNGCIDIIKDSPILGKGLGWTSMYLERHSGGHPTALFFESLLFTVLCNKGFLGLVIWCVFGLYYFSTIRNIANNRVKLLLASLFVYYVSYTGITGDYGYFRYFVLFYTLSCFLLQSPRLQSTLT